MSADLPGMDSVPPLAAMSDRAASICLAWYQQGLEQGIAMGREQVENEWRGRMEVSAAVARQMADRPTYADLADRRGERDRAERQRTLLWARGVGG